MSIFERIKLLSQQRNKNVKEVAIELGFSENLFYKWKTSEPKARDLQKVADYFDVSVDYLLGRTDDPSGSLNRNQDSSSLFFRIDASDMSEEDKMILREDLDDFLALRKKRLIERNAKKDEGK